MFNCTIQYDDQHQSLPLNKMTFFETLYVDFKIEDLPMPKGLGTAKRLQLTIHPKQDITLQSIDIQYDRIFQPKERIFCNGFQSWTESREFEQDEMIPSLRAIAKPFMGNYGDYHIPTIKRGKGHFHSWTYTYIRQAKGIELIGSLSEQTAFTLIQTDTQNGQIHIQKEVDNLLVTHSYPVLDIVLLEGTENAVFDAYFELMGVPKPTTKPAVGWTSWYHYYTNISEEIILKNLTAFQEHNQADARTTDTIFQIDDGYQTKIGDWLRIKDSFPNGMQPIAQKIHAANYLAGLWLAPFVCEKTSEVFQRNPDWLLKDAAGKLVRAGYNPAWSGHFYILDFYNKGVQNYLTGVFHTILQKWGYDMVKLDFLYAVCILPRKHKTRGQIMCDAMQFLRKIVGDKRILACGVPLGSSFGLVDYCRIGADIHLKWEHQLLRFLRNKERVSTIIALRSVLGRWHLNGRAFVNDPDVFILRKENNQLSPTQQHSILTINSLLGNLLFTSDYLADYKPEQICEFQSLFGLLKQTIQNVTMIQPDVYQITFLKKQVKQVAFCNISHQKIHLSPNNLDIKLEPYETIVLHIN